MTRLAAATTQFNPVKWWPRLPAVALAAAMGTVPSLAARPTLLGWALVAVSAVATSSLRGAITVAAMASPILVGLPWPTHCLTAAAAWYLWPGASRAVFIVTLRPSVPVSLTILTIGSLSALAAAITQFRLGGDGPLSIAVARPSLMVLILAVLAAALINSLGEELLWRGILADAAPRHSVIFAYALQGGSFGVAHAHGIPSGPLGIVFAGVYSLVLFGLSRRYGPLSAFITHFVTDVILFTAVVASASFAFVLSEN